MLEARGLNLGPTPLVMELEMWKQTANTSDSSRARVLIRRWGRGSGVLLAASCLLAVWGCQPAPEEQASPSAPPETEPVAGLSAVEMFGRDVISTALPEFATALSPDGTEVYFNRMPPDRSAIRIWASRLVGGRWQEAIPLPFSDGTFRDLDPFVSPDGQRLYFSSNRPVEGSEPKDYDLWIAEKTADGWSEPIHLDGPINTSADEIYSTLSSNGNLYFSVFEAEGDGVGIFRAEWTGEQFSTPERVVIGSGSQRLTNPAIAPDESYLILAGDNEGQADLFVSRHSPNDGSWSEAEPLRSSVLSPFSDFAPAISPDGATLYFTSERPGIVSESEGRPPGDLYFVALSSALPLPDPSPTS